MRGAVLAAVLLSSIAVAQPQPPGGAAYFGDKATAAFTPDATFAGAKPAAKPAPPVPPVLPIEVDPALAPAAPPAPPPWSGSAEFGINGAAGNSELLNLRAGWNAVRKVERNTFVADFLYAYTRQDGTVNQNQALFNARDEQQFAGSPWGVFAATQIEYDELRAFDFRVGVYGGAAYTVVDDDTRTLKLRAGAGATREIGGPQDRWVPEMVFGYDFRYRIDDRSSLLSVLDYYPRIDDWSRFRVRARAAYEFVIDPKTGTVVRLGVQDRYDSDPGPAKRNDLTYFATLGVTF